MQRVGRGRSSGLDGGDREGAELRGALLNAARQTSWGAWRRGGVLAAPGGGGDGTFAKTPRDLFSPHFLLFLPQKIDVLPQQMNSIFVQTLWKILICHKGPVVEFLGHLEMFGRTKLKIFHLC